MGIRVKARYEDKVLRPLVEDAKLIEEIAESDELI